MMPLYHLPPMTGAKNGATNSMAPVFLVIHFLENFNDIHCQQICITHFPQHYHA